MAISVKRVTAILLNTGEENKRMGTSGIYFKYEKTWYHVNASSGEIYDGVHDTRYLDDLLKESGGIYDQLELF